MDGSDGHGRKDFLFNKGDVGYIGETGWMEDLMMGRVLVKEDGEEIDVVNIVEVIEGIEEVGMKSG